MGTTAFTKTPLSIGSLTPIRGVPVLPPASDPRNRFPIHAGFLQEHLAAQGQDLTQWAVLEAEECRLDEDGMEVRFSLLRRAPTRKMAFYWVVVHAGKLVAIRDQPA